MPTKRTLTLLPVAALAASLAFTGCGHSDNPAPAASASSSASQQAGDTKITAKNNGITFDVPSGWIDAKNATGTQKEAANKAIAAAAAATKSKAEDIQSQVDNLDAYAVTTSPDSHKVYGSLNLTAQPAKSENPPTREQMVPYVESSGAKVTDYREIQTPLGKGERMSYVMKTETGDLKELPFVTLIVPAKAGYFSMITIGTGSSDSAGKVADKVTDTLARTA